MSTELQDPKLQSLIDNGYEFRLGDYVSEGFELYKQNMWGFVGFAFIFMAISAIGGVIPGVSIAVALLVSPPLTMGFYIVCRKIKRGEQHEFGDFFSAFDKFGPLAMVTLIMMLMILAGTLCFVLPGIYLAIAYAFAAPLVYFKGMEFWPALEASRKIISKNWGWYFLFAFVVGLISMSGIFLLIVGLFLTMPIAYCIQYAAFDAIIQPDGDEQGQMVDPTDHLIN